VADLELMDLRNVKPKIRWSRVDAGAKDLALKIKRGCLDGVHFAFHLAGVEEGVGWDNW
jgi:phage head maturation protease